MKKISCIYRIRNLKNDKCYIGSTINFTQRKNNHKYKLRNNRHPSSILQNAWNKHGELSFIFEIVENIEDEKFLIDREQFYLDHLRPKYNIRTIANANIGIESSRRKLSKEIVSKIRQDYTDSKNNYSYYSQLYNVDVSTIMRIIRNEIYRNPDYVTPPINLKIISDSERNKHKQLARKLTDEQIIEIRNENFYVKDRILAEKYGVTRTLIMLIKNNKLWKDETYVVRKRRK